MLWEIGTDIAKYGSYSTFLASSLAAITSNREGFVPRLVNGRTLKAMNQWYNKRMKELKLCLPKADRGRVTLQMERITNKRNRQVNHYLHTASKAIIDFLVKQGIGTIIVGKNPLWKQEAGMGRRNNQNFVAFQEIWIILSFGCILDFVALSIKTLHDFQLS